MKRLITVYILLLCWLPWVSAQSCLPEGITFTTQSQIDSFQIIYPNCIEIEGDVQIGDQAGGSNISDLEGLNTLKIIGGYLCGVNSGAREHFHPEIFEHLIKRIMSNTSFI